MNPRRILAQLDPDRAPANLRNAVRAAEARGQPVNPKNDPLPILTGGPT